MSSIIMFAGVWKVEVFANALAASIARNKEKTNWVTKRPARFLYNIIMARIRKKGTARQAGTSFGVFTRPKAGLVA
ncbi:MAG TPA: hypothetical protein VFB72_07590 [Verrucomicrobiae bacterium]|nr:hypothetical protein [Verrucomicrobiae bacterium]